MLLLLRDDVACYGLMLFGWLFVTCVVVWFCSFVG